MRAKSLQPPCGEKCRIKCTEKVSEEDRTLIFKKCWDVKDINRQKDFISKCMQQVNPNYRYVKPDSKRNMNHAFYFVVNDVKVRVCKYFFTHTLDIPNRYIRTVVSKLENGFVNEDLRGRHGNHKQVDPQVKENVRRHINSIPRIESHYLRHQTTREFIEGGKTITDLYRDYKEECIRSNIPFVHRNIYSQIFYNEFNLSFFIPKKDQCDLCAAYNNSTDEVKLSLQSKFDQHLVEKSLV